MEDVNFTRQSSTKGNFGLKSTLSGRSSPRNSPSLRRLHSGRTPRREGRASGVLSQCFRSNRIVLWLLLITLWTYAGFYVQSKWAHENKKEGLFGLGSQPNAAGSEPVRSHRRDLIATDEYSVFENEINQNKSTTKNGDAFLAKKENGNSLNGKVPPKKKSKRSSRRKRHSKQKVMAEVEVSDNEVQEEEIPKQNATYGMLVGPFGSIEDTILEWSPEKRTGTCDRRGAFARIVWSRKFVLIFHELSMTGAPISMMELATELLSCGATVSVVILSKKGGLMPELARRKIKVIEDKDKLSFRVAMKADLIVAGSAVCASWIEQYSTHTVLGSSQIAWWIMENRREYFDRAKPVLNKVKMLIFLAESQSKQWLAWCEEEKIKLNSQPTLIPLSVNDELAFVAGLACSLNTPSFGTERMLEKKQLLRDAVRKEMGLTNNDMLVMSLSSINPGKGQFLLLETACSIIEKEPSVNGSGIVSSAETGGDHHSRALLQSLNQASKSSDEFHLSMESVMSLDGPKRKNLQLSPRVDTLGNIRNILSKDERKQEQTLKILIGSVGSKSNKVQYVKGLLRFLSQHSNLSNTVLWTPATTRVASLYAAADVYVMNSQGLGETFGRVTIEAMAFGLPVLGSDAGGTKEIVEHNVTGLLHPLGRPGARILKEHLGFFLKNESARKEMGIRGRQKVEKMYLKRHMYKKFAEILFKCMRIK